MGLLRAVWIVKAFGLVQEKDGLPSGANDIFFFLWKIKTQTKKKAWIFLQVRECVPDGPCRGKPLRLRLVLKTLHWFKKWGEKGSCMNSAWLDSGLFLLARVLSGWKVAINTATESADRVIIRLTPGVTLSVSKPHSYLLVEKTNKGGNTTDASSFLTQQCTLGCLVCSRAHTGYWINWGLKEFMFYLRVAFQEWRTYKCGQRAGM